VGTDKAVKNRVKASGEGRGPAPRAFALKRISKCVLDLQSKPVNGTGRSLLASKLSFRDSSTPPPSRLIWQGL
jgi:hypothetical protein